MAETNLRQLERELATVSEQTRKAYDVLNGVANNRGLYKKLSLAEATLKKKGLLPGVKEKAESSITRLKSEIIAAEAEYKTYQEKKNALNDEIKNFKKSESETRLKQAKEKSAGALYQEALNELKDAELGLAGYKGDAKYQEAWRKAEIAYGDAVKAGLAPIALGSPKIDVPPPAVKEEDKAKKEKDNTAAQKENLSAFISLLADPANSNRVREIQQDLKKFGYQGPVDGKYSLPFQSAINSLATSRSELPDNLEGADLATFLADSNSPALLGKSATGAAGGSGGTTVSNRIYDATQAASTVNQVVKSVLKRDATAQEIKDLSQIVVDAQKRNPFRTTNGITTGGVDEVQVLTSVITSGKYDANKKLGKLGTIASLAQEALTKKADKAAITKESILATIAANGVQLQPDQIDMWTKEVDNGTDIETVKQKIRNIASAGMPDNVKKMLAEGTDLSTVYSPYKTQMAAILEINPNDIRLTDPSLTAAIGPNGEMPIYEYQRALRKDPRWQYTNNARDAVADGLTTVLKDFGFMG